MKADFSAYFNFTPGFEFIFILIMLLLELTVRGKKKGVHCAAVVYGFKKYVKPKRIFLCILFRQNLETREPYS